MQRRSVVFTVCKNTTPFTKPFWFGIFYKYSGFVRLAGRKHGVSKKSVHKSLVGDTSTESHI